MTNQYEIGEVWYVKFPLEEDSSKHIERPAIIADVMLPHVAVIKITKTAPRSNDPYDTEIIHYSFVKLKNPSTARVSKLLAIHKSQILNKKGILHHEDHKAVFEALDRFIKDDTE